MKPVPFKLFVVMGVVYLAIMVFMSYRYNSLWILCEKQSVQNTELCSLLVNQDVTIDSTITKIIVKRHTEYLNKRLIETHQLLKALGPVGDLARENDSLRNTKQWEKVKETWDAIQYFNNYLKIEANEFYKKNNIEPPEEVKKCL